MSGTSIQISAQKRELESKNALRLTRKTGVIPANIYGKNGNTFITIFEKGLPKEHPKSQLIDLKVDGASKTVILREVQVHPLTDKITHLDFQEVGPTDKVKVRVPLKYVGLSREQEKDGAFKTLLRSLEVKTLASKIPTALEIEVGHLAIDESVHISDIKNLEGVTIIAKKNLALASLVRM